MMKLRPSSVQPLALAVRCKCLGRLSTLAVTVVLGSLAASVHAAPTFDVEIPDRLFGHLKQNLVPGCGAVACGPTATVNSFVFLQNQYPEIYGNKLIPDTNKNGKVDESEMIEAASALTTLMGCCLPDGTDVKNFLPGKMKYIEGDSTANPPLAGKAPGVTVYQSRTDPIWQFLVDELKAGEDVELSIGLYDAAGKRIGGHAVTLTRFKWTDTNMDNVIGLREGAQIFFIDPSDGVNKSAGIFNVGSTIETDFLSGEQFLNQTVASGRIELAVSESPIPEPDVILLLLTGLLGLLANRQRPELRAHRKSGARNKGDARGIQLESQPENTASLRNA